MGTKKGDRTNNHNNKDLSRQKPPSGWADGGGWKKPKEPRRSRGREVEQAIIASLYSDDSTDEVLEW